MLALVLAGVLDVEVDIVVAVTLLVVSRLDASIGLEFNLPLQQIYTTIKMQIESTILAP